MEVIISIVAKIGEYTVSPVGRQLGYLFLYKSNIDNLRTQIQHLRYLKDKVGHSVYDAVRKGEEIEDEVQNWLNRVGGIIVEAEKYFENEGQAYTNCSIGSFPNLVSMHRLSRKATRMTEGIVGEIQNGNKFDKVSHRPILGRIVEDKGYEFFETRFTILREIMESLTDPNVNMIGLYGMGGVGKTMLAKEVSRKAKEEKLFDEVVSATLSQTPNCEKFQQEIGEKLGIEFKEKSFSARADRLRYRLRHEKKILIVVDDVWEKIDLFDVGISFGDAHKGCKILLTSRSQHVLCNDIGVEKNFPIPLLSENEAWSLFSKIVGDSVKDFDIQYLAAQIVRECACLPIAITTVANALKNKSCPVWKDALQELRMSSPTNITGMHANVYSSIKLSYNFLGSEEAKLLLLLCSLHDEDQNISINYLLRYGLGLDMFQAVNTLEEARNRVLTLVESLKSSSLLLEGDYINKVKMHDVIRDVIISVGSKERQMYFIGSVAEMEKCLIKKKLKESYAISLSSNNVDKLPDRMECPLLEFFLINSNNQSLQIPDQFFQETKELRVLDLTFGCFEPRASSLCFLQNLRTLCLFQSKLGNISLLGQLKNLEVLDLSMTDIGQLPTQIGQLTHLRLLDLRYCYNLDVIQPNVISNLLRLEELNMEESFTKWEIEGVNDEQSNANITELENLSQLTALFMSIPDVYIVPEDLFSEKLERFKILIGDALWYDKHERSNSRMLKLKLDKSNLLDKHGLKVLLKRSEELYLDGLEGVKNVVYDLDKEGFPQLKHLEFENNTEIRCILQSTGEIHPFSAFPSLESLYLSKMSDLENICDGKVPTGSFGKLKSITVINCDRLKNLFPFFIVKQLEEIEVTECNMMEEIVTCRKEDEAHNNNNVADGGVIEFPQLQTLILKSLPHLFQFFPSQSREGQLLANNLKPLFNRKVKFPNLEVLELFSLNSVKIWNDQFPGRLYFHKLTRLIVNSCGKIKYLIPSAMSKSLVHLKDLEVIDCKVIKEVIGTCEEGRFENIILPKLESLVLLNLPNLKRFCSGNCIECPSLLKLRIDNCCKLRKFISNSSDKEYEEMNLLPKLPLFDDKVVMSNLEELTVDCNGVVNKRWDGQFLAASFCKLKVLNLSCSRFKPVVLSMELILKLQNLENLYLNGLVLEEIRSLKGLDANIPICLRGLILSRLPNLIHLCSEHVQKGSFQTLRILDVTRCGRLKSFVPSSMSFQNLTALRVSECHALSNLLASSTATSLSQLTKLSIAGCKSMIEIIANEGGDTNGEIVFSKLKILALHHLPSLKSFYSGNSIMQFPLLDKVVVSQCSEMQSFSPGITNIPKLDTVISEIGKEWIWEQQNVEWYFEYIEYDKPKQKLWEGDINSTVQKLWEDHPVTALQGLFTENYEEEACSSSLAIGL